MALRLRVSGSDLLLPDGRTFVIFGSNSRWELAQPRDAIYLKRLGCNAVRIEFPWSQTGSSGDSRDDGSPGRIDPVYRARLKEMVRWYTTLGMWVQISIHSKCIRSGKATDSDPAGYCFYGDDPALWPDGRNGWTDTTEEAAHHEMLQAIAADFKDEDYILSIEPINEPAPTSKTDADINAYVGRAIDAYLAVDPKMLFTVGGRDYQSFKAAAAYMPGRNNVMVTCDLFNQQGSGVDNAARLANFATRLAQLVAVSAAHGVPIQVQQFGSHSEDDPDREILAGQLAQLLAAGVSCFQWEFRTPGTGGTTFGWVLLNGDGDTYIRTIDPALMASTAAGFLGLLGEIPMATSPLETMSELFTEITRLLDGDDPEVSDLSVDTLGRLLIVAQRRIYREVRSRWNEKEFLGVNTSGNFAALPNDFMSPSITHFGHQSLIPVDEAVIRDYSDASGGQEKYFAVAGSSYTFWPAIADGTALQGRYFARLPDLDDDSMSNNLLFQNADDLFVYAALVESAPFFGANDKMPMWEAKYASIVEALNMHTKRAAHSVGRLMVRPSVSINGNRRRSA